MCVDWRNLGYFLPVQVAIQYSGVEKGHALPMVLEIRPGAVDRGACVQEFSQYKEEVEYLWVPGSFLEQVARLMCTHLQ